MKITYELAIDSGFGEATFKFYVEGAGRILTHLPRRKCPYCDSHLCWDCISENDPDGRKMQADRLQYNAGLDILEQLTLAQACNNINIASDDNIACLNMVWGNLREKYPE